jgi:hypothetical protein
MGLGTSPHKARRASDKDLTRCRPFAGTVALAYNWWSLFARLADPDHHRERSPAGLSCCPPSRVEPSMPVR